MPLLLLPHLKKLSLVHIPFEQQEPPDQLLLLLQIMPLVLLELQGPPRWHLCILHSQMLLAPRQQKSLLNPQLPPYLHLILVCMIGVIGLPQMPLAMGIMDSDWRQVTSPRAFMVIDDKEGEEHGLKLQLGKGEKEKSRRKSQFRVCLF